MSNGRCYAKSSMLAEHHQPFNRKGRTFRDSTKNVLFYTTDCANDKEDLEGLNGQQRSVSLTTLHVGARSQQELLEPRMAQLETLEAKMASIEVSLSTTPRRKKGSSISGGLISPVNHRNKDHYKELDALRLALRDKENIIQTLKGQLCNTLSNRLALCNGPVPLNEADRIATEERLQRLRRDADNKRMAIKNLKLALERLDITDNIDVRIQQAELEYRLGREELELLSLREESRALQAAVELAETQKKQKNDTIFSCISGPTEITVHAVEVSADPKSPRFGAGPRDDSPGLYVDWALDDSGLFKGDRIIEVNGKLVVGANRSDLARLLAVAPDAAQIVVLRRGESLGTLHTLRSDNLRLTHRIGYLEEQVRDLLAPSRTDQLCERPPSRQEHLQVFQKGPQVTTLIRKSPCIEAAKMSNLREVQPAYAEIDLSSDGIFAEYHKSKSRTKRQAVHLTRSTVSLDCKNSPNAIQSLAHAELQIARRMTGLESAATIVERRRTAAASHLHSLEFDSEPTYYRVQCDASKCRPAPPKKPLRLSLHRATSLQSVESALPTAIQDTTGRKPIKRNHRGDPPTDKNLRFELNDENSREHPTQQCNGIPQSGSRAPSRAESCQSALRWPSPKARSHFTPVSIDKWR